MQTRTVLLVEDDRDDQDTFIQALKQIKNVKLFDVVNNAKEALERLRNARTPPDVIFMDINMPLMNGMEYLSEMEKYPETRDVPVVMLTTSTGQQEEAIKLGARAFIKKTSVDKDLRSALRQAINSIAGNS